MRCRDLPMLGLCTSAHVNVSQFLWFGKKPLIPRKRAPARLLWPLPHFCTTIRGSRLVGVRNLAQKHFTLEVFSGRLVGKFYIFLFPEHCRMDVPSLPSSGFAVVCGFFTLSPVETSQVISSCSFYLRIHLNLVRLNRSLLYCMISPKISQIEETVRLKHAGIWGARKIQKELLQGTPGFRRIQFENPLTWK